MIHIVIKILEFADGPTGGPTKKWLSPEAIGANTRKTATGFWRAPNRKDIIPYDSRTTFRAFPPRMRAARSLTAHCHQSYGKLGELSTNPVVAV